MRSLQQNLPKFEARNVRIVAVSVDPVAITKDHARKQGYSFLFLSDPDARATRDYDLFWAGGRTSTGADIARPAEFLIDPQGFVRWYFLTSNYKQRPRAEVFLEALDSLGVTPAAN